ncbi:MAG: HAMP domain-containing histidine kinase [Acidobacteria bacterium]|nr:HAMP domain-containing histidine kinase [Acidobacteriota bacterium]
MDTIQKPDLVYEFKRRHRIIALFIGWGASLILVFVFFAVLRNLVIAELEKVRDSVLSCLAEESDEQTLKDYIRHLHGYYLAVETPQGSYTSDNFSIEKDLQQRIQNQHGQASRILRVNGYLKIGLFFENGATRMLVVRADNPVMYYIMMALIVLSVCAILLFFVTKGQRYLMAPVMTEIKLFKELDRAKERFFASIFHELGTPLTSLMSRLESEISVLPEGARKRTLELAYLDAQRISRTTSDQLQRSRYEAGTFTLNLERVDADELFEIVAIRLEILLRHHNNSLICENNLNKSFLADRWKLEQALVNLVTNAIKYGPEGPIALAALWLNNEVWLEVKDQGSGFDPSQADIWIQPFRNRNQNTHSKLESTGLGLYLVDRIANAHGGKLIFQRTKSGFIARLTLPQN